MKPLCAIWFLAVLGADANIVGPGGVVPFGGSGAPGQRISYGRITNSQEAFYVGGSSLYALNGVYVRTRGFPQSPSRRPLQYEDGLLCYENQVTGWHMGLIDINNPEDNKEQDTKWIIIDRDGKDRFIHEGATLLPGSGTGWSHIEGDNFEHEPKSWLHIDKETGQFRNFNVGPKTSGDGNLPAKKTVSADLDELPWQVVGLGDPSKIPNMIHHQRYLHQVRTRALHRDPLDSPHGTLAAPGQGTSPPAELSFFSVDAELSKCVPDNENLHLPARLQEKCRSYKPQAHGFEGKLAEAAALKAKADASVCDGDYDAADQDYAQMIKLVEEAEREGGIAARLSNLARQAVGHVDASKWILAQIYVQSARCLRWARRFNDAYAETLKALSLVSTYTAAIVEQGLNHIDKGDFHGASARLETAQRLDRSYEHLGDLLILSRVFLNRQVAAQEKHSANAGLLAGGEGQSEPRTEPAAESKKKEGYDVRNALRDRTNCYALLEMPVDFVFEDHLKRNFRKCSRAAHPDKNGGSNDVFQEIGRAVETLEDAKARVLYDTGHDLDSAETQARGYQSAEPMKLEIERHYFPERFGYFAFMDPFDNKRHMAGTGGKRRHGNVYNEVFEKPLPEPKKQSSQPMPDMLHGQEL